MTAEQSVETWLEELFNQHVNAVFRYCRVQLDEALAEDVTSEVFLVAWQKPGSVPPGSAKPWLLGVARRLIANQMRSERRRRALARKASQDAYVTSNEPDLADAVAAADLARRALDGLARRDREVLWLAATEDLSQAELGQALGVSGKAAGVRLSRARARLAKAAKTPEQDGKEYIKTRKGVES